MKDSSRSSLDGQPLLEDNRYPVEPQPEYCLGILGAVYPDNPRWAGPFSRTPQPLDGEHYSTDMRCALIPGCVCGQCGDLWEDVPGGLWCVRYGGVDEEAYRTRRARDLFAYHEADIAGYVYLLEAGPYYKVGRSKDPDNRIKTLQIQLPFPTEIKEVMPCDDEIEAEKWFHAYYSERRLNGEWFQLTHGDVNSWGSAWINGEMRY